MKKKFLGLLMSVVLAFGLTPAFALADDDAAGSDASAAAYTITLETVQNGTVKADKKSSPEGATVTLTVKANDGYKVGSVSVTTDAGKVTTKAGSNGTYTFAMPAANVKVSASFEQDVVATPEPAPEPVPVAEPAPEAALEQQADPEPAATDPAGDFDLMEAANPITIVETENGTVTANPESAEAGNVVTLTVEPAAGFELDTISATDADGGTVTIASDNTFTMPETAVTVTATFKEAAATTYKVTVSESEGGTVTADVEEAAEGDKVTLTATPDEGYEFVEWAVTDADGGTVEVTDNAFVMPASDVTASATFKAIEPEPTTYTITVEKAKNGTAKADAEEAAEGDTVTLTATPDKCYALKAWKVTDADGNDVKVADDGTFTMPAANVTVTATFDGPNHTWGEWEVTKEATTTATGVKTRTCEVCGATETETIPKIVKITYRVTKGANSTWTKGSKNNVSITVKRNKDDDTCYSHFTGVQIDGKDLAADDYTAKSGSTIVTLKAATLQKLSTGSHKVTVNFDDGTATTRVNVKAASGASKGGKNSPKTGDYLPVGIVAGLAVLAIGGAGALVVSRKKMQDK